MPRRDGSSIKDTDTSGRPLLYTPSAVTPSSSPYGTQSSKVCVELCPLFHKNRSAVLIADVRQSRSSRKNAAVIREKADTNIGTSRQKPNNTPAPATPFAVANSKGTLPRPSSSALPLTFQPAVKPRIYSTSQPSGKRNAKIGPQRLETFGFVSATSLMPTTTKRNPTIVPPVSNIQDAVSATTLTPILEPNLVRKPISKPIKQEEVHLLGSSRASLPHATRNLAAAATSSPISKFTSKPIKREGPEIRISGPQPLPQTPERPRSTKRVRTPSYSTGTYRDPYAISSDSDSNNDGDNNRDCKPHSCPPLKSFAESADTHETASDVEAVLNQFPAWLDSPSPTELRSGYLGASRPTAASRPGKRMWGDGVANRGRVGRENRRVGFGDDNGFSTSPIPGDRVTSLSRITSCEDGITVPVKQNILPSRGIISPNDLPAPALLPDELLRPNKSVSSKKRPILLLNETHFPDIDLPPVSGPPSWTSAVPLQLSKILVVSKLLSLTRRRTRVQTRT